MAASKALLPGPSHDFAALDPRNPPWLHLQIPAIVMLFITLLMMIPALGGRSADGSYLLAFSADEQAFLMYTFDLQDQIASGDIAGVLQAPLSWGYGYLYELTYALLTLPFHLMDSVTGVLVAGRLLGVLFIGISIFYIYRLNLLLTGHSLISFVLAVSLLAMPGFFVFQKLYSPDQMTRCLWVMSFYYLCRDNIRFGRDFWRACVLLGLATSVRLPSAVGGVGFAAAIVLGWLSDYSIASALRRSLLGAGAVWGIFLLANSPAFTSRAGLQTYLKELEMVRSAYDIGSDATPAELIKHWFSVVDKHFMPFAFQLAVAACFLVAFAVAVRSPRHQVHRNSLIIVATVFFVGMVGYFTQFERTWYWHLAPFLVFALSGVACVGMQIYQHRPKLAETLLLGCGLALIATGIPRLWSTMQVRLTEHQDPAFDRWQAEMYATQETVLEIALQAKDNPESLDVLTSLRSAENVVVYRDAGLRTRFFAPGRFVDAVTKNFPAVAILDTYHDYYRDWTENRIAKICRDLQKPRTSSTGRRYRYDLAQSVGRRYVFRRVDAPKQVNASVQLGQRSLPNAD